MKATQRFPNSQTPATTPEATCLVEISAFSVVTTVSVIPTHSAPCPLTSTAASHPGVAAPESLGDLATEKMGCAVKVSMSSPCNNTAIQCHNDYQTSEYLGLLSHYRCPHACVHMLDMCRGVTWCATDLTECGPDLRCPRDVNGGEYFTRHSLTSTLVSSQHYFCLSNQ